MILRFKGRVMKLNGVEYTASQKIKEYSVVEVEVNNNSVIVRFPDGRVEEIAIVKYQLEDFLKFELEDGEEYSSLNVLA